MPRERDERDWVRDEGGGNALRESCVGNISELVGATGDLGVWAGDEGGGDAPPVRSAGNTPGDVGAIRDLGARRKTYKRDMKRAPTKGNIRRERGCESRESIGGEGRAKGVSSENNKEDGKGSYGRNRCRKRREGWDTPLEDGCPQHDEELAEFGKEVEMGPVGYRNMDSGKNERGTSDDPGALCTPTYNGRTGLATMGDRWKGKRGRAKIGVTSLLPSAVGEGRDVITRSMYARMVNHREKDGQLSEGTLHKEPGDVTGTLSRLNRKGGRRLDGTGCTGSIPHFGEGRSTETCIESTPRENSGKEYGGVGKTCEMHGEAGGKGDMNLEGVIIGKERIREEAKAVIGKEPRAHKNGTVSRKRNKTTSSVTCIIQTQTERLGPTTRSRGRVQKIPSL